MDEREREQNMKCLLSREGGGKVTMNANVVKLIADECKWRGRRRNSKAESRN